VAAIEEFPNAEVLATRTEYEYAHRGRLLASAVDAVRSVKKLHHIARRSDATVVTGHDPDAWPKFKQSPEAYD
jgi:glyoxylase-like metal-dependent hydrolase (beta-lactamase superfamily II)